jgi:hypothetical protein
MEEEVIKKSLVDFVYSHGGALGNNFRIWLLARIMNVLQVAWFVVYTFRMPPYNLKIEDEHFSYRMSEHSMIGIT